jgi:polyhydroxyalkanoate synthesis regulator phasin
MDHIIRGIATAAPTLQSVLLQALVHKGVLTRDEAMAVADKVVAAARERSDEDEEDTADISAACLEEVREGPAAMAAR